MKFIKFLSIASIFALTFTSCSDDDTPAPVHEEEVITTMRVVLTETGTTNTVTLQSQDLDGDGPDAPVITGGTLKANTNYSGVITLLNETELPVDDITEEVKGEAEAHQFFYNATSITSTFAYAGTNDRNGNPVGVEFTVATGAAGTGNFVITLRHEPNKTAAGVMDGDITNAGGSTDFVGTFPITIQ